MLPSRHNPAQTFVTRSRTGFAPVQDTTVVQLIPYGWEQPDGSVIREPEYAGMAAAANASYWLWVNPDEQNAFLHRCSGRCSTCGPAYGA